MAGIRVDGDFRRLRSAIRSLENFDYSALNEAVGDVIITSTAMRFREEKDPKGRRWKKSIRAQNEGGQTLTNNSDLKTSIRSKVTDEGVAVGTDKVYAGTHQDGGRFTIRAKNKPYLKFRYNGKWISKREVNIKMPKRQFLGINQEDLAEIKATMEDAVRGHVR